MLIQIITISDFGDTLMTLGFEVSNMLSKM